MKWLMSFKQPTVTVKLAENSSWTAYTSAGSCILLGLPFHSPTMSYERSSQFAMDFKWHPTYPTVCSLHANRLFLLRRGLKLYLWMACQSRCLVSHRELNKACHRPWLMFLTNGKKSIVCCELNVQPQRYLITAFFGAHTYNLIHRTLGRFVFTM
jgi:hypothetical protein